MKIKDKVALVLGASRGIGRAIAHALAKNGAKVVLPYFDWPEDSEKMKEDFQARGHEHTAIQVDLREPDEVLRLIDMIRARYGRLEILINNIERGGMPIVHGPYTSEQWDLEMATTLKAKWWSFQYALPLMQEASEGAVVVLSSIAGVIGRCGPAGLLFNDGYAAANRAVSSLTDTWARLAAPRIRVNELMLGIVDTRHGKDTRGWSLLNEKDKKALQKHTLLQRTGQVDEVVSAVLFLLRDATYMTGGTIRMDGGFCLGAEPILPMPEGVL